MGTTYNEPVIADFYRDRNVEHSYALPEDSEFGAYNPYQSYGGSQALENYNNTLLKRRQDLEAIINSRGALPETVADGSGGVNVGARETAAAELDRINKSLSDSAARAEMQKAAQAGEQKAGRLQNRQIDPTGQMLLLQAAEGKTPSQAEYGLENDTRNLYNSYGRQSNQMFNQAQGQAQAARTYNAASARSAMMGNNNQQSALGGKSIEGQQALANQYAAMRAQEMARSRGAYGQYVLGQQAQNDQAADTLRGVNITYQQLRQQGAAQQAAASRDQSNMYNQAELASRDIATKRYVADQQNSASVIDTLIPWK